MPKPATAGQPMADELKLMKEWIKEDVQVKAIIGCKLSLVVQNILDEGLSACEQWEMLVKIFARLDLFTEKLKDAEDATQYLGVFENGRCRFAEMRITFTDEEAIFMLLNGLPDTPQWVVFHSLTIGLYNSANVMAPSSSTSTSISFEQVATLWATKGRCKREKRAQGTRRKVKREKMREVREGESAKGENAQRTGMGSEPNRERSKYAKYGLITKRDTPRNWLDDGWMLLDDARWSALEREKRAKRARGNAKRESESCALYVQMTGDIAEVAYGVGRQVREKRAKRAGECCALCVKQLET
ncbi:hypothetical protein DFJ58DRAFT_838487 [Suillus subalutaceus]|uniref:uncharacterized protein n=1 Tax=Suillus subalutaceus TaxID=48586 RepID=UPI001B88365F|nr:uncharacterized protein DFJ58DRAFT_838487 [Suillus subalutaceus]KAG1865844.1 hypothetical protein DFJ58DRAFT_838487 [Suillus subalutaceus]